MSAYLRAQRLLAWIERPLGALLLAAGMLLAGGCASPGGVAPGSPATELAQRLGPPTARYPATADAGERWQYSHQPAGQQVFNLDLDAQGRVARVEQALNTGLFGQRIQPNHWTRQDVLREYGPPARVEAVHNFDGDIWVWRYLDGPTWRLLYIDIDRAGVVRGWSSGDENLPDPPEPR